MRRNVVLVSVVLGALSVLGLVWMLHTSKPSPTVPSIPGNNAPRVSEDAARPFFSPIPVPSDDGREPVKTETAPSENDAVPPAPQVDPLIGPNTGVEWPVEARQVLGDQTVRIVSLTSDLARLRLDLDECKNGIHSVLGNVRTLPEWTTLSAPEQLTVTSFLTRFPVFLTAGEARMIATYVPFDSDATADLIAQLGRERVLLSLSREERERFQRDEPFEFEAYFGRQ